MPREKAVQTTIRGASAEPECNPLNPRPFRPGDLINRFLVRELLGVRFPLIDLPLRQVRVTFHKAGTGVFFRQSIGPHSVGRSDVAGSDEEKAMRQSPRCERLRNTCTTKRIHTELGRVNAAR